MDRELSEIERDRDTPRPQRVKNTQLGKGTLGFQFLLSVRHRFIILSP